MQEITINNTVYPLHFSFAAFHNFGQLTGLSLQQLENMAESMSFDHVLKLIWCGLKAGARKAGREFTLTEEDVINLLDDDPTAMATIMKIFEQSQAQIEQEVKAREGNKEKKPPASSPTRE